jgi:hypothetical protein
MQKRNIIFLCNYLIINMSNEIAQFDLFEDVSRFKHKIEKFIFKLKQWPCTYVCMTICKH